MDGPAGMAARSSSAMGEALARRLGTEGFSMASMALKESMLDAMLMLSGLRVR
jgi:NADP-dependent 3-hydroxy acid dehydrogenase YdfG